MTAPTPQQPAPAPMHCPRCGTPIGPEQDWCLACGAPARTRLAPTPNWRLPIAAGAVIALLCGIVLAWAFVELTQDETPAPVTVTVPATSAPAPVTTAPAAPVDPNATATDTVPTAPPATQTVPTATVTTPTATATTPTATTGTTDEP